MTVIKSNPNQINALSLKYLQICQRLESSERTVSRDIHRIIGATESKYHEFYVRNSIRQIESSLREIQTLSKSITAEIQTTSHNLKRVAQRYQQDEEAIKRIKRIVHTMLLGKKLILNKKTPLLLSRLSILNNSSIKATLIKSSQTQNTKNFQSSFEPATIENFYGISDPQLKSQLGSRSCISTVAKPNGVPTNSSNLMTVLKRIRDFEYKQNVDKSGQLGSPGFGNYYGNAEFGFGYFDISGGASLQDTNKARSDKDLPEMQTGFRMFYLDGQFTVPRELDAAFLSGSLIGAKGEAAVNHSRLAHENSPLSLDFYLGRVSGNASVENYSASIGAKAEATGAELKVNPFNWFGFEPLEEWFGIEWSPYVGVEFSLGSIGASASVGLNNELYAAYGIGVGIKFGAEKDD